MRRTFLAVALLVVSVLIGCGEKEEVNPQVVNNPSPELIEQAKSQGADAKPAGSSQASSSIN